MVLDLIESSLAGFALDSLTFGGAPAPEILSARAGKVFPTAMMCAEPMIPITLYLIQ